MSQGTGQDLFGDDDSTDASGNAILRDIGTYLRDAFKHAKPVGSAALLWAAQI